MGFKETLERAAAEKAVKERIKNGETPFVSDYVYRSATVVSGGPPEAAYEKLLAMLMSEYPNDRFRIIKVDTVASGVGIGAGWTVSGLFERVHDRDPGAAHEGIYT